MKINQFKLCKTNVPGVTAVQAKSNQTFSKHWHDEYGIGLIDVGAQSSLSGRGIIEAVCGNTIAVNPGEVHDGKPLDSNPRQWRMLYFQPQHILEIVKDISLGALQSFEISQPMITNQKMAKKFDAYYCLATATTASPAQEELLFTLISDLMQLDKINDKISLVPPQITQAIELMDDEPTHDIQLTDLAALTGLSRYQVLRGVSSATGLTPHAYILQKRVDLARQLIHQGENLCSAAYLAGFSDQSHMHRVFVKKYGITPGKFALSR